MLILFSAKQYLKGKKKKKKTKRIHKIQTLLTGVHNQSIGIIIYSNNVFAKREPSRGATTQKSRIICHTKESRTK
jgi:hypothetical protein